MKRCPRLSFADDDDQSPYGAMRICDYHQMRAVDIRSLTMSISFFAVEV